MPFNIKRQRTKDKINLRIWLIQLGNQDTILGLFELNALLIYVQNFKQNLMDLFWIKSQNHHFS